MLPIFGWRVILNLWKYYAHKITPHNIPCIFIIYNRQSKDYRCLDPSTSHIYINPHVMFDKTTFSLTRNIPLGILQISYFLILRNHYKKTELLRRHLSWRWKSSLQDKLCRQLVITIAFVKFDQIPLTRTSVLTTCHRYKSGGNDKKIRGILKIYTDDKSSG